MSVGEVLFAAVFGDAYGRAKRIFTTDPRRKKVEDAVLLWANALPPEFQLTPGSLFLPPSGTADELPEEVVEVRSELHAERLPSREALYAAFISLWRRIVARNAAAGDEGAAFFQRSEEEIAPHLLVLAEHVDAALRSDAALSASTAVEMLRQQASVDHTAIWKRYRTGLASQVSTFSMVGLPKVLLSADDALPLQLADSQHAEHEFEGRYLHDEQQNRMIVTGDPGTGKSGLIRLIAHELVRRDERVARARLKTAAARLAAGDPMADALASAITDGFGSVTEAKTLLESASVLLLDGLDETQTSQQALIDFLSSWQHPARIIVTSRDATHATALPDYGHFVLTPLETYETAAFVKRVASTRGDIKNAIIDGVNDLLDKHRELATPLLIGFVLGIAFDGGIERIPTTPARLYERMLHLVSRESRRDRTFKVDLDPDVAMRNLATIAWHRMMHNSSDVDVLLNGTDVTRTAIEFWEERGILELQRRPRGDEFDFAHQTVADFSAAKFLVSQPDAEIERLANEFAKTNSARLTLRFASGLGKVEPLARGVLMEIDVTRTLLAGEIVEACDAPIAPPYVVERLSGCISGDSVPTVALEASSLLASIARSNVATAKLVAPLVNEHATRTTVWDRLGALRVRIAIAHAMRDASDVASWMIAEADAHTSHEWGFGKSTAQNWWNTYQDLIAPAIESLHVSQGSGPAIALMTELDKRQLLTMHSLDEIRRVARDHEWKPLDAAEAAVRLAHAKDYTKQHTTNYFEYEQARHEAMCQLFVGSFPETTTKQDGGVSLAILFRSFGYMESSVTDSSIFVDADTRERFVPVIRMWAAALSLDAGAIGEHARGLLAGERDPWRMPLVALPKTPKRDPAWTSQMGAISMKPRALLELLNAGSHIGLVQRMLGPLVLFYRPRSAMLEAIDQLLAKELRSETWRWLALNAAELWGGDVAARAAAIVSTYSSEGAFGFLVHVPRDVAHQPAVRARMRGALDSAVDPSQRANRVPNARIAAAMLEIFDDEQALVDAYASLASWTSQPVVDNPRTIPDSPVDILAEFIAEREPDTGKLIQLAITQAPVRPSILRRVRQAFDPLLWDRFLATAAEDEAIKLLSRETTPTELNWLLAKSASPVVATRIRVCEALTSIPATESTRTVLATLLRDPSPEVRDAAFRSMRGDD